MLARSDGCRGPRSDPPRGAGAGARLLLAAALASPPALAEPADDERAAAAALGRAVDQAIADGKPGRAAALLRGLEALTAPSPAATFRLAELEALAGRRAE